MFPLRGRGVHQRTEPSPHHLLTISNCAVCYTYPDQRVPRAPAEIVATNPYISQFTLTFIEVLTWAIIARSLLSWFPVDQSSPLFQMLHRVTDPIIDPIKRVMPQNTMIDLSPMAAIFMMLALSQMVRMLTVQP